MPSWKEQDNLIPPSWIRRKTTHYRNFTPWRHKRKVYVSRDLGLDVTPSGSSSLVLARLARARFNLLARAVTSGRDVGAAALRNSSKRASVTATVMFWRRKAFPKWFKRVFSGSFSLCVHGFWNDLIRGMPIYRCSKKFSPYVYLSSSSFCE